MHEPQPPPVLSFGVRRVSPRLCAYACRACSTLHDPPPHRCIPCRIFCPGTGRVACPVSAKVSSGCPGPVGYGGPLQSYPLSVARLPPLREVRGFASPPRNGYAFSQDRGILQRPEGPGKKTAPPERTGHPALDHPQSNSRSIGLREAQTGWLLEPVAVEAKRMGVSVP